MTPREFNGAHNTPIICEMKCVKTCVPMGQRRADRLPCV